MQVVDLAEDFYQYKDIWNQTLTFMRFSNDRLRKNYLSIDPQQFVSFTTLIKDNKIICFSGLQADPIKWGDRIARCSSRMWIHPEYRFQGMVKFTGGPRFLNSYYCLPVQINKSKELGYECVFMSRDTNKKAFAAWNELVNKNCQTQFVSLDEKFNLCGNYNNGSKDCVQYVSIDSSNKNALDIWKTSMGDKIIKD